MSSDYNQAFDIVVVGADCGILVVCTQAPISFVQDFLKVNPVYNSKKYSPEKTCFQCRKDAKCRHYVFHTKEEI